MWPPGRLTPDTLPDVVSWQPYEAVQGPRTEELDLALGEMDPRHAEGVRAATNEGAVDEYADLHRRNPDEMPRVDVFSGGGKNFLADSGHRLTARQLAGSTTTPYRVRLCQDEAERTAWPSTRPRATTSCPASAGSITRRSGGRDQLLGRGPLEHAADPADAGAHEPPAPARVDHLRRGRLQRPRAEPAAGLRPHSDRRILNVWRYSLNSLAADPSSRR